MEIKELKLTELTLAKPCDQCADIMFDGTYTIYDVDLLDEVELVNGEVVCSACKGKGMVLTESGNAVLEFLKAFS